jgi:hypothetical protein
MSSPTSGSKNKPSKKPSLSKEQRDPEDGSDILLRNIGWLPTYYMELYPRWYDSSSCGMCTFGFYDRLFQNSLLNFKMTFELAGIDFWSKLKQNAGCWPSSGWQRSSLLSMRKPGQREAPMFMRESQMKIVELSLLCADITIWKKTSPNLKVTLSGDRAKKKGLTTWRIVFFYVNLHSENRH